MQLKSRLGVKVTVSPKRVIRQERHTKGSETYYVLFLANSRKIEVATPMPGIPISEVDPLPTKVCVSTAPEWQDRKLPKAEDCPSAGMAMVAGTNVDYHAHEKVKGETFFTHKTAPGLVIKSPEGKVIHETKMSDMYRRRD